MSNDSKKNERTPFSQQALDYHKFPKPGKIAILPTTSMETQTDLALAYSPGVAVPCEEIAADPMTSYDYTSKGNLVAVITEGTAVLGLGDIGALAAKPVMEGKSVLFKKFANIDSVDVEIDMNTQLDRSTCTQEEYVQKFVDIVASLEPTYGGINLEDIKAPECFEIERRLKERMKIPVFHDDQHGTAIITTAALKNWIEYSGRDISKIKVVASGAGASAISCLKLMEQAGLKRENIRVCDRRGVIYKGRKEGMSEQKEYFAVETEDRTIAEAIKGADVFLGLSGPGAIDKDMVASMAEAPLIMSLANPTPEIMPEEAKEAKPDAIICTGRSDYPNQVNNVLCFPFLFRGALDVGATQINEAMKMACVEAIASLARREAAAEVAAVYSDETLSFGPEYLIPKPFDPRLISELPVAVAKAAMESGIATRPIEDFEAYELKLREYFIRTQLVMRPFYIRAKENPKRVVYCEGEDKRVLQAVQTVLDEGIAKPTIIGRRKEIEEKIKHLGLRYKLDTDVKLVELKEDSKHATTIGATMVNDGEADAFVCGSSGSYPMHLKKTLDIIGLKDGVKSPAALGTLVTPRGIYFFCDTHVNTDPSAEELVETALMAIKKVKRFGQTPRIAVLSHSNFGSHDTPSAKKMHTVCEELRKRAPDLEIEGEVTADLALRESLRKSLVPHSELTGNANLFIMPNLDAASIAFYMTRVMADGLFIGPILMGVAKPAYIATPSVSTRGLINITALASVGAQMLEETGDL